MDKSTVESRWEKVWGINTHTLVVSKPSSKTSSRIVIVSGFLVSGSFALPTAENLSYYCPVYLPDLPGFGRSGNPSNILTLRELSDALAILIQKLGGGKWILVGSSFGSQIVAELCVQHPDLVEKAVLIGPTINRRARCQAKQLKQWMINMLHEPRPIMMIKDYYRAGIKRALKTFQYALDDAIEAKLPLMEMPTLVAYGSRDAFVPHYWAEEVASRLPDSQLVCVPGATHSLVMYEPGKLSRLITSFIKGERAIA